MVEDTFLDGNSTNNANTGTECPVEPSDELMEEGDGGFDWDAQMQGLVLSSFSFGYVTTQLVGGVLAERFGAKWIFGVCILLCSLLEFLVPVAAKGNVFSLMGVRAIQVTNAK